MTKKYEAINWNKIENRVDYSAWSRLSDFIWEPERIPVNEDKAEFDKLDERYQETFLRALGSLAFLSTIQVKIGDSSVKMDAATPQEISVFGALNYLEAIANKGYSNAIKALAPEKADSYIEWANEQRNLQEVADLLTQIYQRGTAWQKKIALSFTEMAIYHVGFYGPLYLFGQGKHLSRSTELLKYAIRSTSFNAMYPGVKFRLELEDMSGEKQKEIKIWVYTFTERIEKLMRGVINELYGYSDSKDDALHYFRYTLNKNLMNLGYPTVYPDSNDDLSTEIQQGVIKSANFESFFFYNNSNPLTDFHEIKDKD